MLRARSKRAARSRRALAAAHAPELDADRDVNPENTLAPAAKIGGAL